MSRLFLTAAVAMLCMSATATASTAPRADRPIIHVDLARSANLCIARFRMAG